MVGRAQVCSLVPCPSLGTTSHLRIRPCLRPASMLPWKPPYPNPNSFLTPLPASVLTCDSGLLRAFSRLWKELGSRSPENKLCLPHQLAGPVGPTNLSSCVCVCALSCVRLFGTPWTIAPGSSVRRILQARRLEWVAGSFSRLLTVPQFTNL